jgi:hypothetical protein
MRIREEYMRKLLNKQSYPIALTVRINNLDEFLAFYCLFVNMDTIPMTHIQYHNQPDMLLDEYIFKEYTEGLKLPSS